MQQSQALQEMNRIAALFVKHLQKTAPMDVRTKMLTKRWNKQLKLRCGRGTHFDPDTGCLWIGLDDLGDNPSRPDMHLRLFQGLAHGATGQRTGEWYMATVGHFSQQAALHMGLEVGSFAPPADPLPSVSCASTGEQWFSTCCSLKAQSSLNDPTCPVNGTTVPMRCNFDPQCCAKKLQRGVFDATCIPPDSKDYFVKLKPDYEVPFTPFPGSERYPIPDMNTQHATCLTSGNNFEQCCATASMKGVYDPVCWNPAPSAATGSNRFMWKELVGRDVTEARKALQKQNPKDRILLAVVGTAFMRPPAPNTIMIVYDPTTNRVVLPPPFRTGVQLFPDTSYHGQVQA